MNQNKPGNHSHEPEISRNRLNKYLPLQYMATYSGSQEEGLMKTPVTKHHILLTPVAESL